MDHKLLLLGLLHRQQMHGYQLFEYIEGALAACTDLKKPTAYYWLAKMADEGLVTEETDQEGNRPPRRVYRLTSAGEAAYRSLLRQNLAEFRPATFPGDAGLAFAASLPPEEVIGLLRQRRQTLHAALQEARSAPAHGGSLQWVIEHQVIYLSSELGWLDSLISRLVDSAKSSI